jgi:preprotein translocase subunit YajC
MWRLRRNVDTPLAIFRVFVSGRRNKVVMANENQLMQLRQCGDRIGGLGGLAGQVQAVNPWEVFSFARPGSRSR